MSKSARRFIVLICLLAAVFTTVLLSINYARNSEFRTAAAWHRAHGNIFLVNGHRPVLPQDWWGEDKSKNGKFVAVKASRDLTHLSQSAIAVGRKSVEANKRSGEEIRKALESFGNVTGSTELDSDQDTSPNRVGVDPQSGEYVIFPETNPGSGKFHGYAVEEVDDRS